MDAQIVVGLLVDRRGFPLEIGCLEGNKAETLTIVPAVQAFQRATGSPTWSSSPMPGMLSASDLRDLDECRVAVRRRIQGHQSLPIWRRTSVGTEIF